MKYYCTNYDNDIALIRLDSPVVPRVSGASSVGFVKIAGADLNGISNINAIVSGWGLRANDWTGVLGSVDI
jgi:hypothetical protein